MTDRVLCSKCQADDVIYYDAPETAVCPACCEDHDYEHDGWRNYYCTHCGQEPPDDWYYSDDDVGLFGVGPGGPGEATGVPAAAMNGNAMDRHKDPAAWDRWVAFCNSWGHP